MFLQECSIERLLESCAKFGVSSFEVDGEAVRVEFGSQARRQVIQTNPLGSVLEVKAPPPDATVEELERAAPEHPLDAILNAPEFSVQAPTEDE